MLLDGKWIKNPEPPAKGIWRLRSYVENLEFRPGNLKLFKYGKGTFKNWKSWEFSSYYCVIFIIIVFCNYRKIHFYLFISLLMSFLQVYLANKPQPVPLTSLYKLFQLNLVLRLSFFNTFFNTFCIGLGKIIEWIISSYKCACFVERIIDIENER